MKPGDIQIVHVRNYNFPEVSATKHNRGGATIAMQQEEDGKYSVSTAFCNISDNFNASIGRQVAIGRLTCKKDKVREDYGMSFPDKASLSDYLELVVQHYGDNVRKLEFVKEL